MKAPFVLIAICCLCLALAAPVISQEPTKQPSDGKVPVTKAAAGDEAKKPATLTQPGFLYVELVTDDIVGYIAFFETVSEFKLRGNEGNFAWMTSAIGQLMFVKNDVLPDGHPNKQKAGGNRRGSGLELCLVVADLNAAYAKTLEFKNKGWKISAGIGRRPWGASDFRVLSPDGYYLRITDAH